MNDTLEYTAELRRWQGDRRTYHLLSIEGEAADAIAIHERLHRLEFGARRGFGSVKVIARIGETQWKSSVFPQRPRNNSQATHSLRPSTRSLPDNQPGGRAEGVGGTVAPAKEWILLVSKKVMRAEDLTHGDLVQIKLELL